MKENEHFMTQGRMFWTRWKTRAVLVFSPVRSAGAFASWNINSSPILRDQT